MATSTRVSPRKKKKEGMLSLQEIPRAPGIYRFWDSSQRLIYVGKAKNLHRRLAQYQNAKRIKRHWKMRMILQNAERFEFQVLNTDQEALLKELEVIQTERPKFNIAGAFARFYPYIAWNRDDRVGVVHWGDQLEPLLDRFEVHGAFRSRGGTREAFEAWLRLLKYVYRSAPLSQARGRGLFPQGRAKWKREQWAAFSGVSAASWGAWRKFFEGSSTEALEDLLYRLMDSERARDRRKQVQKDINVLKHFFRHEAEKLRGLRLKNKYAAYPVPQIDRDRLTLKAQFIEAERSA